MLRITLRLLTLALVFPAALSAQASTVVGGGFTNPLVVSSYTMPNGNSSQWRYLDYIYPDADNLTDNGLLSGGTGLLTNGLTAPRQLGEYGFSSGWPSRALRRLDAQPDDHVLLQSGRDDLERARALRHRQFRGHRRTRRNDDRRDDICNDDSWRHRTLLGRLRPDDDAIGNVRDDRLQADEQLDHDQ